MRRITARITARTGSTKEQLRELQRPVAPIISGACNQRRAKAEVAALGIDTSWRPSRDGTITSHDGVYEIRPWYPGRRVKGQRYDVYQVTVTAAA